MKIRMLKNYDIKVTFEDIWFIVNPSFFFYMMENPRIWVDYCVKIKRALERRKNLEFYNKHRIA